MKKNYSYLLGLVVLIATAGASCLPGGSSTVARNDGGVYKSIDRAQTWTQKTAVPEIGGKTLTISNAEIKKLLIDPIDHNTVYAATLNNGLFVTYDGGDRWSGIKGISGQVNDVAVDYFNKCRYVVALPQKAVRTTDCGRGFKDILNEARTGVSIKFAIADHFNPNVLYVGTSKEVLKSGDFGETWSTVGRFNQEITDLRMDRRDSRIILAGLKGGLQLSKDSGKSWTELSENLKKFSNAVNITHIEQSKKADNTYVIASDYGLVKTVDGGITFDSVPLLTPPNSVKIKALATDPSDGDVIYYSTATTLYQSNDGGATWETLRLPTTREASYLTVDYKDGKVIYLGIKNPPKK